MKLEIGRNLLICLMLIGILLGSFSAKATDQLLILDTKQLTMDTAVRIATASIDHCRKSGVQVTVTVVDRSGHLLIAMRDTLAMDLSIRVSQDKAYTAMIFNTPSAELANRFVRDSITKMDGVIVARGGLPINVGGYLLGGVGVSGAPSGITDEACAQAGLNAVLNDLEMTF